MIPPDVKLDEDRLLSDAIAEWRMFGGRPRARGPGGLFASVWTVLVIGVVIGAVFPFLGLPPFAGVPLGLAIAASFSAAWSFPRNQSQRAAVRRVLRRHGVPTCTRCGYDLRPTPVVVCCPECGEANLDAGSEGPS